jgi:hypothetical protein
LDLFRPIKDEDMGTKEHERQLSEDWARVQNWQRAGFQGRWVEVLGVFDKEETGHFGMLKHGGLRDVEAIVLVGAQ